MDKSAITGYVDPKERNGQFENISHLRSEYQENFWPIISVDTKKKEQIGQLNRRGQVYSKEPQIVYDHDYRHLSEGVGVPHGIYDVTLNKGFVTIGTSKETAEFVCDCIARWWNWRGRFDYPDGTNKLLILVDAGGANAYRSWLFKEELTKLADRLNMTIRIAHYPSYTSKWNPIEHRLFCHVTRAMQGVVLKSHELMKYLIGKTSTKTGLSIKVYMLDKVYKIGKKYSESIKKSSQIIVDEFLGKWNYCVQPSNC